MSEILRFPEGGYRYVAGVFQYSAGVAAEPGFVIERARFARPRPLAAGFAAAEAHLAAIGRPLHALCACELRSPAPFTESGFLAFNRDYVEILGRWGVYRDGRNPIARTNVCPAAAPPPAPALHAFSYTVPAAGGERSFVIAGGGEAPEGKPNYRDHIVRLGDTSPAGLREKVRYVVTAMGERLAALGFAWADALAVQAYSIHDVAALALAGLAERGAAVEAIAWHACRPPVVGLDYEMDLRRVVRDLLL